MPLKFAWPLGQSSRTTDPPLPHFDALDAGRMINMRATFPALAVLLLMVSTWNVAAGRSLRGATDVACGYGNCVCPTEREFAGLLYYNLAHAVRTARLHAARFGPHTSNAMHSCLRLFICRVLRQWQVQD